MTQGLGLGCIQAVAIGQQQRHIERPAGAGNSPEQAKARAMQHAQQGKEKRPDVIGRQGFKRPDMAGEGRGHDREVSHWQKIEQKIKGTTTARCQL